MAKKEIPSSLNYKALLEVLFWTHSEGLSEDKLLSALEVEPELLQSLLTDWQKYLHSEEKGFVLEKRGEQWILSPKKEYSMHARGQIKQKRVPLNQREIIALLFYEGPLSKENIEQRRGKSSGGALKKLEAEGFLDKKEGVYALASKCREVFGLDKETT